MGRERQRNRDRQLAALLAAAGIIGSGAVYWGLQIRAVLETLAMAYG
jgi:hypothetical protein